MKVLVTYTSKTGNTKKVAEAIYDEIQSEKDIKELNDLENLEGYDLSFVGFPIEAFGPEAQAKKFLGENSAGKDIVLFTTHAAQEDSETLKEWLANCRTSVVGGNVVGMFDCQGELSQAIADALASSGKPDMIEWASRRSETIGQPDEARIERARVFAREIMQKYVA